MARGNPWDAPGWHALHLEASLIQQLVGSGVTALGKANYASRKGEYYNAFFGLSVGIERLAKVVLVTDYAIDNGGRLPDQKVIRAYGHELITLLNTVDTVSAKRALKLEHTRPQDPISRAIIECLDDFADAKRGRYANFQALGEPNLESEFEPIRKWWADVAEPILKKHFANREKERRVKQNADLAHALFSEVTSVNYFNEAGETIQDIRSASLRSGQTESVQKFGRYYTLLTVRWLACVHREINDLASNANSLDAFYGHSEFFDTFRVEDIFLKTRIVWPL